jgi:phosphatidylinositol glycan class W
LQSRRRFFTPYTPQAFIADWLINCGSVLFVITVYSRNPVLLNALLLLPAVVALLTPAPRRAAVAKPKAIAKDANGKATTSKPDPLPIKPFVTMYRGSMMVITCAAILAVDFKVFPRRFAKVENWGTSLMDLGVGSFVFSAGVVAARSILKSQGNKNAPGLASRLYTSLRHSLPLLVLGVIRLISVKGVDYAEHVTEYGVHWNFFFTLGLLPPFVAVCQSLLAYVPSYEIIAVVISLIHELALDNTRLTAYIIAAPRENLISQNREGIFSFFGYLAIFLAGQGAGMHVLPRDLPVAKTAGTKTRITQLLKQKSIRNLAISAVSYIAFFIFLTDYFGINLRVSRRLANLPYVLWTCAFNTVQLLVLIVSERFLFPNIYSAPEKNATTADIEDERRRLKNATSPLLRAMNRNGLPIFLLANLLTGAVNLSIKTLDAGTSKSMAVLMSYMAILGATAVGLDYLDLTIKL